MTPSLQISQNILNRLIDGKQEYLGKLYGILAENNLVILGLQLYLEDGNGKDLVNSFPAEVDVCGIINIGDAYYDQQAIRQHLKEVYVTDNPVFINYKIDGDEISTYFFVNGQLENTTYTAITEQEILSQFLHVRLQGVVPLFCELGVEPIQEAFLNLRKNVASGIMSFGFSKNNIYLLGNDSETGVVGVGGNPSISDLCDEANDPCEGGGRRKKTQHYEVDVLNVTMLKRTTQETGAIITKEHAPLCVLDKKQCKTLNLQVPIDALAMLHRQSKLANLYEIIVESAIRNLRLLENTLIQKLEQSERIYQPEPFHFYPQNCGHFITKFYLKNDAEELLASEREKLHKDLMLELTKPLFRRANQFPFKTDNKVPAPLFNPHEGLKPTDNGGKISLVKGKYQYYHYCQNKMDDNGWGCAYRSLQTLASWFKLQGYTDKEVPSFSDIQKCLVDIGDKPKSFVGSKQWIGSTEVNFVLNTVLGVVSKILYVSSGEDMAAKGPELISHFEVHGSPVMIGGGVLAHTILGVDYNSQTGNLKFLILDPHYTGGEDLHTIQSKGWCGWKGVDFWDKAAYYNMCLPLVPVGV